MVFRTWFYVCKLAGVCLLLGGLASLALDGAPAARIVRRATFVGLISFAAAGAGLGLAVFVFGVKLRCPRCGRPGGAGGHGSTFELHCDRCGVVHGNVVTDFALRVDPPESAGNGSA